MDWFWWIIIALTVILLILITWAILSTPTCTSTSTSQGSWFSPGPCIPCVSACPSNPTESSISKGYVNDILNRLAGSSKPKLISNKIDDAGEIILPDNFFEAIEKSNAQLKSSLDKINNSPIKEPIALNTSSSDKLILNDNPFIERTQNVVCKNVIPENKAKKSR